MPATALTLRDLEYVVALAEHRHFGRAADACGVSQPALSAQLKKVEGLLGERLFERTRRRVLVTTVGEEVAARGREVAEAVRRLVDGLGSRRGALAGQLRLGLISTLGPYLLPHVLGPLRRRYPRLELHLKEGLTRPLREELRSGRLDALLVATRVPDEDLEQRTLFHEPFLLALPRGHPLARRRRIERKDIHAEEMVLLEEGHCLREQALEVCPARGGPDRRLQATSLETLRHLVASGAGYSLVPALAAREDRLGTLIRYRRLPGAPGRSIALVWRQGFSRPADVAALGDLIREAVPRGAVSLGTD